MVKIFITHLMSFGFLLSFCGIPIAFAETANNWQAVLVDDKNVGYIDKSSIKTVFPSVELKSHHTGDYKIADLKITQNPTYLNHFAIFSLQFDCKNSLMAFYRLVKYNKDNNSKEISLDLPLFANELPWQKANFENKSDNQIYNFVCKGIVPSFPQ